MATAQSCKTFPRERTFDLIDSCFLSNMSGLDINRVLSIQSHVVHGYVGNKCAVFPMQVLGFEVDSINSVQFSNHTGYDEGFKGQVLDEKQLSEIFSGLVANDLHKQYTHLLTGYIGNKNFLAEIANIVKTLRAVNPSLIYVCDPVMGDDGAMYVPEDLLPVYRDTIIPLADVVTPNQYEAELLTGKPIESMTDALEAIQWFHDKGVKTVALTSCNYRGPDVLVTLASHNEEYVSTFFTTEIDKQGKEIRFTGAGDLFAALFLAHSTLNDFDMSVALERTIYTVQAVITKTLSYLPEDVKDGTVKATSTQRELKIIQSKDDIEHPKVHEPSCRRYKL